MEIPRIARILGGIIALAAFVMLALDILGVTNFP
jgi:hypothetical protein